MCFQKQFQDHITQFPEQDLIVWGVLQPNSNYFWVITDISGNEYTQPFTTNSDGIGTIDITPFPAGFFNVAMNFTIQVKESLSDCEYVPLVIPQKYERICVSIRKSNTPKINIGCEVDLPIRAGFTAYKYVFIGDAEQVAFPLVGNPEYVTITGQIQLAKQLLIFVEGAYQREGEDYTVNYTTGIITFAQSVEGQEVTVIINA